MTETATPNRKKLTALIPAGNEERHIQECIESVSWADEVMVVVDKSSTDKTQEIAREHADAVLVHEYVNSASQKNWAIPQVEHDWLLVVDADERCTDELRKDILRVLENDGPHDGYRIFRQNHLLDIPIKGAGWQRDDVLRLFRSRRGRYEQKHVHADVVFDDGRPASIGVLQGKFLHFTFESFDQYLKKFVKYTEWAGEDRAIKTKKVGWRHLLVRPLWRFVRHFFLFRGYRDGKAGFIISMMAAFSVFLKYARVWEMRIKEKQANEKE